MRRLLLCAALVVGMPGLDAGAQSFKTGNDLLVYCRNLTEKAAQTHCLGYVTEISGTLNKQPDGIWRACLPKGASDEQMAHIVIAWLDANPSKRHLAADTITLSALAEAFPCKKKP